MECEVVVAGASAALSRTDADAAPRAHVMIIGSPLRPGQLADVTQRIADAGGNIQLMTQLASLPAACVELIVADVDVDRLKAVLVQAADEVGLDIAVERAGLRRRATRLVVLDLDSTLIRDEGIDRLAVEAGVETQVAKITEAAMAGDLDFEASLRARVELLAGLPVERVHAVRDSLQLTPGAQTFVRTLKWLGYRVGIVSGGFTVFTDRFRAELGLDFAAANSLEVEGDRLTGRLLEPIVDRAGKAAALRSFAERYDVPMAQTIAVGDGANDIDMLSAAGLGIAFNAKSALRAAADASVNQPHLDSVLFVLGLSGRDIAEASRSTVEAAEDAAEGSGGTPEVGRSSAPEAS